jgi:outer membrane receptor for ferric coprogen and ferric-rhodotorulic acid
VYGDPAHAYAPRSRAYLVTDWTPAARWSVNVAAQWTSGYTVSSPNVFGLRPQPSYTLVDAAVHYAFPVGGGTIALELDGHNITDEHPYETLVGDGITPLRGRFVSLGARFRF